MKKKLTLISIPIIIAVIGLLVIQGLWILATFTREFRKAEELKEISLGSGLLELSQKNREAIDKTLSPKLRSPSYPYDDSISVYFSGQHADSINIEYIAKNNRMYPSDSKSRPNVMDFTIGRISVRLPQRTGWQQPAAVPHDMELRSVAQKAIADLGAANKELYTKADSALLMKHIQRTLKGFHSEDLIKIVHLKFAKGADPDDIPEFEGHGGAVHLYQPPGLNNFLGERRWVVIEFNNLRGFIAAKMLFYLMISCFLTFLLIFSIVYLIKLILRQKQLADMKDDFINNLTHEFKTPIATVSAAVEGLQKFNALNDPEKTNRYLDISRTELNRLNDMVTKVLNISSYERKNLELDPEMIDLAAMITEVTQAESFRNVKPVNFTVDISPGVKEIYADALHLKNVVSNLVDNAVKYSKDSVDINITAYGDRNMVYIKIKDNGIGIPASAQKFVFDKFYRVTNGNLYNVKGNGLGLSYVKFVVEAHGGNISFKSEINVGTEFLIAIPLK